MNSEKGRFFTIATSDGKSVEYEILFTFDSDDLLQHYMGFGSGKGCKDQIQAFRTGRVMDTAESALHDGDPLGGILEYLQV